MGQRWGWSSLSPSDDGGGEVVVMSSTVVGGGTMVVWLSLLWLLPLDDTGGGMVVMLSTVVGGGTMVRGRGCCHRCHWMMLVVRWWSRCRQWWWVEDGQRARDLEEFLDVCMCTCLCI